MNLQHLLLLKRRRRNRRMGADGHCRRRPFE
jgi:hypothetical protein